MKATNCGGYFADICVRANLSALRGSFKNRAFRDIGACGNMNCEIKHGQTVLRKQDEWPLSSVIQKHSGECLKPRTC